MMQEPIIIHENVEQFNLQLLRDCLGDLYSIDTCLLKPDQLGWPVRRPRRYTVLVNLQKASSSGCSPADFVPTICRTIGCTFRDFLCADESVLEKELAWARARPSVK